jgi:hypothetical protein
VAAAEKGMMEGYAPAARAEAEAEADAEVASGRGRKGPLIIQAQSCASQSYLKNDDFFEGQTPRPKIADALLTDLPPRVQPGASAGVWPAAGGQPLSMVAMCRVDNSSLLPLPRTSCRGLL